MEKANNTNIPSENHSRFTGGKSVNAIYIKPDLIDYENNPLILALPRILTTEESIRRLAFLPDFNESVRKDPDHIRLHKLSSGIRVFSPLDVHLEVERRISVMLRAGYIERNPIGQTYYKDIDKAVDSISQYGDDDDSFQSTKYHGFNIFGASGVGKTQAVERVLHLYPQVIRHSMFNEKNFTVNQLVWLKLDCPFDGSIKGLCLNFFQTVDRILGTNYLKNYGSKRVTVDEMIPSIALVASLHCLGVLVIDEIQRLKLTKTGNADRMLNFFTQLVNTVGVPVVLIGTYKALSLFKNNISQARRGTGQGDLVWDRMALDKQWETFIGSLWKYQCTRQVVPEIKKQKISHALYEETQGITDLAIKAFILAQHRAIESGKEVITSGIIRSVVRDSFKLLLPALEALRNGDKRSLDLYEDIYPKFKEIERKNTSKVNGALASQPEVQAEFTKTTNSPSEEEFVKRENCPSPAYKANGLEESTNNVLAFTEKTSKMPNTEETGQVASSERNVLGDILAQGTEQSAYQNFLVAGYIRNSSEFEGGLN